LTSRRSLAHIRRAVEQTEHAVKPEPVVDEAAGTIVEPAFAPRSSWLRPSLLPIALAVALLARTTITRIYARNGHPGAALDDAYIHFQYARALAEGHPFRFQAGAPTTSGATSLLWPVLLAPFWLLGFRDEAILWPAWALSFVALGALAYEAREIVRKLAGEAAGVGAAAMVVAFPAFTWFAASGMEVLPFAWLLARSVRRASEWAEANADGRTLARASELAALAWGATLMRPEGALVCFAAGAVLARFPRARSLRARAFALVALAPLVAQPLFLLAATGAAKSSTAAVKLLPGNPYYVGSALRDAILANASLLAGTLLDGEAHSAEFLPPGGAWLAFAGLAAVGILGWRTKRPWRAAFVIGLALAIFGPCAYVTFLWNRLRYLWPFATGWLLGLACLAKVTGDLLATLRLRGGRVVVPLGCGIAVGMLLMRLDGSIEDVARSASEIDRQQVTLGRWVKEALPESARIGLNDTGAIAYFGERRTFDVVGLTTRSEGRYWVGGVGSRLEHYERLARTSPDALPNYFIVYPEWFGIDALLGAQLREATVPGATILGGQTMRAHVADYSLLGSGETPWTNVPSNGAPFVDVLDVADLESEAEHAYALLDARDGEEVAGYGPTPDGRFVLDGGRTMRSREHFVAHLHAGERTQVVIRLAASLATRVRVRAGGAEIALFEVEPTPWTEAVLTVPAENAKRETPIDVETVGGVITVFHYWFVESRAELPAPRAPDTLR